MFLYQLQRHSDHHANPTRRYQALRHFEESPQLPAGYAVMILVALFPPLWFRLMDPRVVAHHDGDLTKASLHPPRRNALLDRWMPAAPIASTTPSAQDAATITAIDDCARHQCPNCRYIYSDAIGCEDEGYPPGTRWASLPLDWQCPHCAVREKPDFVPLRA